MTHLTTVLSYTVAAITDRKAEPAPPAEWPDALGRWDGERMAVREALRRPVDLPLRSPFPQGGPVTVGDWTRRLAHEFAIHRLDAESALSEPPVTRYSQPFAEDGIDEFLVFLTPRRVRPGPTGIVQARTENRSWTVLLHADQPPTLGEGTPDLTLSGPADDVYRALWGRPNAAELSGDRTLLQPLAAP